MESQKVIVTNQKKSIAKKYSFENEIGLSTYDLALISTDKIIKKNKSFTKEDSITTFLI